MPRQKNAMIKNASILALMIALGGCAGSSSSDAPRSASIGGDRPDRYGSTSAPAGQIAVAAIGTPFYLVFKTALCGGSLVVAGPTAAFFTLTEGRDSGAIETLGDGLAANCGPPYVLTPS